MRILVVGAGAVGGYFGARLVQSGADVTFLVRASRAARLRSEGITLVSPEGARTSVPVATTSADELRDPYDLILLAVKATSLDAAIEDIAPAVGEETVVLPVLNGIGHIDKLEKRIGRQHVLGGLSIVAAQLDRDGAIHQLAPGASISFGELDGASSSRVDAIAKLFASADFDSRASNTIVQDMWEKWLFMAAGGSTTVLLGGTVGEINAVKGGTDSVRTIVAEVTSILDAAGHAARPEASSRVLATLTAPGSPFTTSLYRDFMAGRPTEVESILGDLIRVGASNGISSPLLSAATVRVRVHQAKVA
jgi:2-dehydropantoate 2-reductase